MSVNIPGLDLTALYPHHQHQHVLAWNPWHAKNKDKEKKIKESWPLAKYNSNNGNNKPTAKIDLCLKSSTISFSEPTFTAQWAN